MSITPYLSFEGRCEEAIEFYKKAVGAELQMLMRFKDNPEPPPAEQSKPGTENKILHASFKVGDSIVMASDGYCLGKAEFKGFGLAIAAKNEAEADQFFNALSAGGQVTMPLARTFWSPRFGMLLDKFGVCWMVTVVTQ